MELHNWGGNKLCLLACLSVRLIHLPRASACHPRVMKELHCHRPSFHRFVCTLFAWMWRSSTQNVLGRCVHKPAQSACLGWPRHYWHLYAKRWFENVERCSTFFRATRFIAISLRAANNYIWNAKVPNKYRLMRLASCCPCALNNEKWE